MSKGVLTIKNQYETENSGLSEGSGGRNEIRRSFSAIKEYVLLEELIEKASTVEIKYSQDKEVDPPQGDLHLNQSWQLIMGLKEIAP